MDGWTLRFLKSGVEHYYTTFQGAFEHVKVQYPKAVAYDRYGMVCGDDREFDRFIKVWANAEGKSGNGRPVAEIFKKL